MSVATELSKTKSPHLKKIELSGVFQLQENRNTVRKLFNSEVAVVLFKPDFTDDESDDHDCSEEESMAEAEDSHSSQDEE